MRRSRRYESIGVSHIGTLLAEAIGDEARVRQALGIWPAWEQAVGPQVAAAARPVALRNGVLTVHVKHAVWLQELVASRVVLLKRIRKVASAIVVRDLRFKVAPLPDVPLVPPPPPPPRVSNAAIPYELARAIRAVTSPALRSVMLRVAARWSGNQSGDAR